MSLVTLGRADFRGSALAYIIIQFPDMSNRAGLPSPALPETAYNPDNRSSKISPTANGSVPNPAGDQSIFCDIHHGQIQHFQETLIRRKYRL